MSSTPKEPRLQAVSSVRSFPFEGVSKHGALRLKGFRALLEGARGGKNGRPRADPCKDCRVVLDKMGGGCLFSDSAVQLREL